MRHTHTLQHHRPGVRAWWLGLLVMLVGGLLLPSTAQARGRRTVPNLRQPRAPQTPLARKVTTIGLTIHMASVDGVPIANRRAVAQWVARANRALKPHGLAVEIRAVSSMPGFSAVTRRRDRRQLAGMAEHDGTIHLFVTETLDPPASLLRRRVRGLHWRYHGLNRNLRQREYVVVTLNAPQTTFAHEIGHLLGLRHSTDANNIMCSCRRGSNTAFTLEQGSTMRQGVGRFSSRQRQARRRAIAQRDRWARRTYRR
ncbi:MAG: matrixin family metalloprotease [Myxococcota bacterium]